MRDYVGLYLMRLGLRLVSNAVAWRFYCVLSDAYRQRPDLARER